MENKGSCSSSSSEIDSEASLISNTKNSNQQRNLSNLPINHNQIEETNTENDKYLYNQQKLQTVNSKLRECISEIEVKIERIKKLSKNRQTKIEKLANMPFKFDKKYDIVSSSEENVLKIWDITEAKCLNTLKSHKSFINDVLILSKDRILTCSDDQTIKLWDSKHGKLLNNYICSSKVSSLSRTKHNEEFLSGNAEGLIVYWNINSKQSSKSFLAHINPIIQMINLSSDKDRVISCSKEGTLKMWNIEKIECLKIIKCHSQIQFHRMLILPDLNEILAVVSDGKILKYNLNDSHCGEFLKFNNIDIYSIEMIDENRVAFGIGGNIEIWDINKKEPVDLIKAHSHVIYSLKLLNGDKLLSGSFDGKIKLWNLDKNECVQEIHDYSNCLSILELIEK